MSIVLDAGTKKLEVVLGGAVAANQLPFVASYADYDDATPGFTPEENDGVTNDAVAVTLVAAPGGGVQRLVNNISVFNKDTAQVTVTIQYDNGGVDREIVKVILGVGYSLHFREDQWQVLNTAGAVQLSIGGVDLPDLGDYARGFIIRGGAVDWEAYDAKTNHFILVGDGTDVGSKVFDWDDMSTGVGADMVHSHQAAGEGGQIDHGLALTGLGDDDHTQYLLADGSRNLGGNLGVDAGVTIDGVDISGHDHSGAGQGGTVDFDSLGGDCDLADLTDYARGSVIRGGAADWEALTIGATGTFFMSTGVDAQWSAFDWDVAGAALGADMVHAHTTAEEGGPTLGATANPLTLTIANDGLHVLDTGNDHDLIITPGTNLTADRILTLTTGDAARTITLTGNPTLADWFDQDVKAAANVSFNRVAVVGGASSYIGAMQNIANGATSNAYFTLPAGDGNYLIYAGHDASGDGWTCALSFARTGGTAMTITAIMANSLVITKTNFDIKVTNNSGIALNIQCSALRMHETP